MTITALETFILHVPVTRGGIADSTHSITHWGMPGVMLKTDTEHIGYTGLSGNDLTGSYYCGSVGDIDGDGADELAIGSIDFSVVSYPDGEGVGLGGVSIFADPPTGQVSLSQADWVFTARNFSWGILMSLPL